ncbi:uncharacterized protein LOC134244220 isoform X2 [Saccostrea cucullata]|uniref:uncharacterized protein LOC134244220 isoform X2 n=1 Tax=Saccostrea cuccullata TaxID=36930 RepID=UPI002ED53F79
MMFQMFCVECGTCLNGLAKFCGHCGAQVQVDKNSVPTCSSQAMEIESLSPDAKKSLAFLKAKYSPALKKEKKEKKGAKSSTDMINEIQMQILDGKKKALKRAFPSDTGLTGALKLTINPAENATEWMRRLNGKFSGKINFIPYIMGPAGLEEINEPEEFNVNSLASLKTQKKTTGTLKMYALAKGKGRAEIMDSFNNCTQISDETDSESSEMDFVMEKSKTELPQILSKKMRKRKIPAAKPVEEYSIHISDDSDLPDIPLDNTDSKCHSNFKPTSKKGYSVATISKEDEIQNFKPKSKKDSCSVASISKEDEIQESACSSDTACYEDEIQLTESPNSYFEQGKSHFSPEEEIIDEEMKRLFDVMEMKIKRKKMAEDAVISFPNKEDRKLVTIIYEDHGGMSLTRPFNKDDTLQSVFTYICREVDAEILPPAFHLECTSPLKCQDEGCRHCFELEATYNMPIASVPDVLILKEGNFLMDDTLTNYGNVLM